jgi:hypothetical protein
METRIRKGLAKLMALCLVLMIMPVNVFAATSAVTVGAQVGTITAATTGPAATFTVTTTGAADGEAVTIDWFEADGTTPATTPAGATVVLTAVAGNSATITVNPVLTSVAGTYYFKATVETEISALVTLIITPNKTALTAAITAEVGAIHTSPVYILTITDYTTVSWNAYTAAIATAIAVEADASATQTEIDDATTAIATSITGLVRAYTLASSVEQAGGAGYTRDITIGGAYADAANLAGKYLVVQFTQGTGTTVKVSVVMISSISTSVTVSYPDSGTKVEAWLTGGGMPKLTETDLGVTVYANVTTD